MPSPNKKNQPIAHKNTANAKPQQGNARATLPLSIAISSRALFNMDESHTIFIEQGLSQYSLHQIENENVQLERGGGFSFVSKLLNLQRSIKKYDDGKPLVEVVLLSRNNADSGLRIFNSIQQYDLPILCGAFCSGEAPYRYAKAYGCHLFLSLHSEDVQNALNAGMAAATLMDSSVHGSDDQCVRIAFDGDAVLFSDRAEAIYRKNGLNSFKKNEQKHAKKALDPGPFRGFVTALHQLQKMLPTPHIRTALITARTAPTHERVIRTLREWKIRIDECVFVGERDKTEFLRAFGADIFFDDRSDNCVSASAVTASGHVPYKE